MDNVLLSDDDIDMDMDSPNTDTSCESNIAPISPSAAVDDDDDANRDLQSTTVSEPNLDLVSD